MRLVAIGIKGAINMVIWHIIDGAPDAIETGRAVGGLPHQVAAGIVGVCLVGGHDVVCGTPLAVRAGANVKSLTRHVGPRCRNGLSSQPRRALRAFVLPNPAGS